MAIKSSYVANMEKPNVQCQDIGYSDDFKLRPSWVDAKTAFKQASKGRVAGSRAALWLRALTQKHLYAVGFVVQSHAGKVIFAALLFMSLLSLGLKQAQMETNFETLWIEEGGRLQHELDYVKRSVEQWSIDQMVIQTPATGDASVLTRHALLAHLRVLRRAIEVSVDLYDRRWTLKDLCIIVESNSFGSQVDKIVENLTPCLFITPLDCFWEGSLLLDATETSPSFGTLLDSNPSRSTQWSSLNPMRLIDSDRIPDVVYNDTRKYLTRMGLTHGYQNRPCLEPDNSQCPATAPNWLSGDPDVADVGRVLAAGCHGLASQHMFWPVPLLLGGVQRNRHGDLNSARAIQTILPLMAKDNLYHRWKNSWKTSDMSWRPHMAGKVLSRWQDEFAKEINRQSEVGGYRFNSFSMSSLQNFMHRFAELNLVHLAIGFGLILVYAFVSLYRLSDPVHSLGGLALAGVVLVALAVVAGLGLCALLGLKFNACTTRIIPFLIMGLGVNDIFVICQSYASIDFTGIAFDERVAELVKRAGVGVLLTSLCNVVAFLCAAILPIRAVRQFALQAAVLLSFSLAVVLVVYPAVLSVDMRRRRALVYDMVCCWSRVDSGATDSGAAVAATDSGATESRRPCVAGPASGGVVAWLQRRSIHAAGVRWWRWSVLLAVTVAAAATVWGATGLCDGLELTDVVPRRSAEHEFFTVHRRHYSVFQMFAVTQGEFDYPHGQRLLYEYHDSFVRMPFIVKNNNGGLSNFWLIKFRDWLTGLQESFDDDWRAGRIVRNTWHDNASSDGILAYKLLVQTGRQDSPTDSARLPRARLVSDDGIINPGLFYKYLSAWAHNDALAYSVSGSAIFPEPKQWLNERSDKLQFDIPTSAPIQYAQIPLYMSGLNTTELVLTAIRAVRANCRQFERQHLANFPTGTVFTFWEQYLHLRPLLLLVVACVCLATGLVVAVALMNAPAAALLLALVLLQAVALLAVFSWLQLRLNAVTATMLVLSVGVSAEFTVHMLLAFLTNLGDRVRRVQKALESVFQPLFNGAVSTLVGVAMLWFSEYDFVVHYFCYPLLAIVGLSLLNGLVVLPVLLAVAGPAAEVRPPDSGLAMPPPSPQPVHSRIVGPRVFGSSASAASSSGHRAATAAQQQQQQQLPPPAATAGSCNNHATSRVSLSTITEESGSSSSSSSSPSLSSSSHLTDASGGGGGGGDGVSVRSTGAAHDIIVRPQVVVETLYPPAGAAGSSSSPHGGGDTDVRYTTTVTATTRVKVEVHAPSRHHHLQQQQQRRQSARHLSAAAAPPAARHSRSRHQHTPRASYVHQQRDCAASSSSSTSKAGGSRVLTASPCLQRRS